jgi:hypothetical protein
VKKIYHHRPGLPFSVRREQSIVKSESMDCWRRTLNGKPVCAYVVQNCFFLLDGFVIDDKVY